MKLVCVHVCVEADDTNECAPKCLLDPTLFITDVIIVLECVRACVCVANVLHNSRALVAFSGFR